MQKNRWIILIMIFIILTGFKKPIEEKILYSEPYIPIIHALLPEKNSEPRLTPITHIVIHFSSNAAHNPKNPFDLQDIRHTFIHYGVSAHYLIGRKGEIYQLVPENRVAYHAGKGILKKFPQYKNKLNQYSIGIELMAIGTKKEMSSMISSSVYHSIKPSNIGFTNAQYHSLNLLLNDIIQRNPFIIKDRLHIIGHNEYAPGRKSDPGSLFRWSKIAF